MIGNQPRLVRHRFAALDHPAVFGHVLIGQVARAEVVVGLADHLLGAAQAVHRGHRLIDHHEPLLEVLGIEVGVGQIVEQLA